MTSNRWIFLSLSPNTLVGLCALGGSCSGGHSELKLFSSCCSVFAQGIDLPGWSWVNITSTRWFIERGKQSPGIEVIGGFMLVFCLFVCLGGGFCERVLRSYPYQSYLCPSGSNFIVGPPNERWLSTEGRRGRNTRGISGCLCRGMESGKPSKPCREAVQPH